MRVRVGGRGDTKRSREMSPMGLWISDVSACAAGWFRKQLREVSPTTLLIHMEFIFHAPIYQVHIWLAGALNAIFKT